MSSIRSLLNMCSSSSHHIRTLKIYLLFSLAFNDFLLLLLCFLPLQLFLLLNIFIVDDMRSFLRLSRCIRVDLWWMQLTHYDDSSSRRIVSPTSPIMIYRHCSFNLLHNRENGIVFVIVPLSAAERASDAFTGLSFIDDSGCYSSIRMIVDWLGIGWPWR